MESVWTEITPTSVKKYVYRYASAKEATSNACISCQ